MKHSIIIPTYARAELLSITLNSLVCQDTREFEVIVVCDGQDSETLALSKVCTAKFPLRWFFLTENRGQSAARNRGAKEATGEILLFLDDDVSVGTDWLFQHARHYDLGDVKDIVVCGETGELYERPASSNTECYIRQDRERIIKGKGPALGEPGDDFDLYVVCGLNCSVRRSTFFMVGGFDEALRDTSEDLDLGIRLYREGVRFIYEPTARAYHRSSKNLEQYFIQSSRYAGKADAHRLKVKRQRNKQMLSITMLHRGRLKSRLISRAAWKHPSEVEKLAQASRWITEIIGSKAAFERWKSFVSAVQYWQGVRSAGLKMDELDQLVGYPTAVLNFHSISVPEDPLARFWVRPERFRRFIEWLRFRRFNCVTPADVVSGPVPARSVSLTFDDGYEDFYFEVFPYVESCRLKPTVFVVVDQIGGFSTWDTLAGRRPRKLLSKRQISEMQHYGVQFGSHSLTHPWLPSLADAELHREVAESKSRLEDLLGREVSCFAYPSGGLDCRVRSAVAVAGYDVAVTTRTGLNFWQDPLCLSRSEVTEVDGLWDFILRAKTGRSKLRETYYNLFISTQAAAMRLPDPITQALRKLARSLGITFPWRSN